MNWDQIEGSWNEQKGKLMSTWGKLTNDDVESVAGKRTTLLGLLQSRYGRAKQEAEQEIDLWAAKLK
ncbi:MAG: CsbD family protein [Rhizomicrobium sp.]|nr:CsbD family protein [Rhizomicrobium sp.]